MPLVLVIGFILNKKGLIKQISPTNNNKDNIGSYKQKIAVVPFTNLNKDEDGAFLVDGIVEDLITELSMIKEIEILSRQSCFDFREKNYSLDEFKKYFGISHLVRLRVNVLRILKIVSSGVL